MSSEKLWKIPLWSIPIFVAHGIEEYLTFSYNSIPSFISIGQTFQVSAQSGFLLFQLVWWMALIISVVLIKKRISILAQLSVLALGGVYIYELEHIINAVKMGSYYAGLFTSIPLIIMGFLFWKELVKVFIKKSPH